MADKTKHSEEKAALTEWQKRNIEFLNKKQQQAEKDKKLKEKLLNEKIAQAQGEAASKADQEEGTDEAEEEAKVAQVGADEGEQLPEASEQEVPSQKDKPLKVPKEKSPRQQALQKGWPVLLVSFVVLCLSIFMITPYSKVKDFSIKGNKKTSVEDLVRDSGIKSSDYWITLLASPGSYENAILKANPWVKKVALRYRFPNHFRFDVTEFDIIAYAQVAEGFQPILENGKRVAAVKQAALPKSFLILNLEHEKEIQDVINRLTKIPSDLVKAIKSVSPANSQTTKDLLLLEMHDGNLIRVPRSQLELKLPYYQKIKKNLDTASIVDMEVGIYTTTADIENMPEVPVSAQAAQADKPAEASSQQGEEQATQEQPSPEIPANPEATNPSVAQPTEQVNQQ
ncbi:TPA: FtsQ-type POTRA domain-containing protein [Streptococcus equi subsp. zooepidemicus]|uniref:cell division protein FtsQ/DivIB n=1 Tax=Streptococcus equi TaxID=1336 RepID=UPI00197EE291|nr:FtsQ-type POTRA domain-containing protein [Streptococcus equi]MCD3417568.1 FtsQ-type POTRA domain-containing protein [Streptococcus equi subsp. zooepidemicus]QTZ29099.1 Cell division protein DivIB [Streptococcus equi subsp. zooepidemicus]HEK9988092.1 FtsQ-type POTRA domain-containing protein [Streptococcus equi subsp. zooepidemicus]HEL0643781.1 FtsQ-type POTRA domain-containing protein [Streptococcus equi subsp. zooepidemicus]HEL1076998.1 FtsQ-type POTRA domain-containing protein [Streptoco